jgi:hypothetical protein
MMKSVSKEQLQRVRRRLMHLYGGQSEQLPRAIFYDDWALWR